MKIIIDVSDKQLERINRLVNFGLEDETEEIIVYGKQFMDNATNKDIFQAIFPNGVYLDQATTHAKEVTKNWLNMSYQDYLKGEKPHA